MLREDGVEIRIVRPQELGREGGLVGEHPRGDRQQRDMRLVEPSVHLHVLRQRAAPGMVHFHAVLQGDDNPKAGPPYTAAAWPGSGGAPDPCTEFTSWIFIPSTSNRPPGSPRNIFCVSTPCPTIQIARSNVVTTMAPVFLAMSTVMP